MATVADFGNLVGERLDRMCRDKPRCFNPVLVQQLQDTVDTNSSPEDATGDISGAGRGAGTGVDPRAAPSIQPHNCDRQGLNTYQPLTASMSMP